MKRALAERAKQSAGLPTNGGLLQAPRPGSGSPDAHSLSPDGRPLKVPKREDGDQDAAGSGPSEALKSSQSAPPSSFPASTSTGGGHDQQQTSAPPPSRSISSPVEVAAAPSSGPVAQPPPTASSPNSSSLKRQRPSIQVKAQQEEDDENDENQQFSSFFLKHQNRALASELKALQYQLTLLERERDYRRKQCRIASQALNSLQATWTQMETELHQPQHSSTGRDQEQKSSGSSLEPGAPMSTGTGTRVEIVGALFDALAALATTTPPDPDTSNENGEADNEPRPVTSTANLDPAEKQQLEDLSNISWNVLQRANALERWIWSLIQKVSAAPENNSNGDHQQESLSASSDQRALTKEIGLLRGQCREYKIQIAELAKARDDTALSERKVRRSIYRLSTGRVNIEQVLKDLEASVEDGSLEAEAKMEALAQDQANASAAQPPQNHSEDASKTGETPCKEESTPVDSTEVNRLQKQLEDLEQQISNRDKSIDELQNKASNSEKRITELCSKELSEEDAQKVQLHEQSQKKLEQVEKELADMQRKLNDAKENWAKARGDADLAMKSLDELQNKQKRRWEELTENAPEQSENTDAIDLPINLKPIEQAQKIIELDHKLKQALENVRQADVVRQNLKEALSMNSSLQSKLEELKGKYAAVQASRSNSASAKPGSVDATNHASGSTSSSKEKSSASEKIDPSKAEKLHREHRRMRKELAALVASKDAAKSKLERVEKERDSLMDTNARLLRQSAEKDDMNAKSLSTILHLKNLTEQLTQGKASLEQQLKSAGQLALASRLATNAKDRVAEEVVKEKEAIEKKLEESEERNASLKKELQSTISEWSEADAKISILNTQLSKAMKRSDELVGESEQEQKDRRKLQDSLDMALRKAGEATEKLNQLSKQKGGVGLASTGESAFSVEQLNTQVTVLKGRLACPVCHYRDKDCIIMRCRHMFCRHCVDENIQNRSRKCPSCGLKFSEKDVDDVWL